MPLQKSGSSLTVVMSDPFDIHAINTIEKSTGYKVQAFVGVMSDIIQALESYYKIALKKTALKGRDHCRFLLLRMSIKGSTAARNSI